MVVVPVVQVTVVRVGNKRAGQLPHEGVKKDADFLVYSNKSLG